MAKTVPGMGYITSRGQKVQRLFQQYFIIDDDENVVANHQPTVLLLRSIIPMSYLTYHSLKQ